jgi:DNA modification methylase
MPMVLREYGIQEDLVLFWKAWIDALRHTQPRLLAYLVYMTYRLFEMRRILKASGSLYLHCDPNASHYIKVIMDGVFGHANFQNEISWKRTHAHGDSRRRFSAISDRLLVYSKTPGKQQFNRQLLPYDAAYVEKYYRHVDPDGRRYQLVTLRSPNPRPNLTYDYKGYKPHANGWAVSRAKMEELDAQGRLQFPSSLDGAIREKYYLDEMKGVVAGDVWTDIGPISAQANERLGYPTQKPIALLKRIIEASSNPGGIVFDPFAGCGTAIYAAHLLGRKWIGCDIAILSVAIVRDVLLKRYGLKEGEQYQVSGIPRSVEGAQDLFERDPRQFQHWTVELSGGFSSTKHSGDLGIDGRIHFETADGLKNMVISVKGGKLSPSYMRELRGTVEREDDTELGGFICLQPPTKGMEAEAARAGMYTYQGKDYERLQIRTVEDLLAGKAFDTPSRVQTLGWTKQGMLPL